MSSIDDRVVNMQFNNEQFQKGIAQSSQSLDEFKKQLNFDGATSGLDNIQSAANRFSLSNMENALDNIQNKLGVFGAIGFSVLNNLTNTALNAGKSMADALIQPILGGGEARAEAIQKAEFQFQGLKLNVQQTMDVAKQSVLGTAYSLDQAATAAGQLGASGITAGHGLEGALRGIAGTAAQTGASYDSISQIFVKVAGNGRLMGDDLLQLSANGVNAAAVLANAMGKPEATIRQMVTDGKISFQQFSDAMGAAFGDNAKKANELFSGALDNMRAALARLGAEFEGPKLLNLRDIFNALSPLIDNVHAALLPLINDFNAIQNSGAATVVNAITNLLGPGLVASIQNIVQAIISIGTAINAGFREIFPEDTAAKLTAISIFLQRISAALIPTSAEAKELQRSFAGLFAIFDIVGQVIGAVVGAIGNLLGVAAPAGNTFLDISAKLGDFLVRVDEFLKRTQLITNFFSGLSGVLAVPIAILRTFFGVFGDVVNVIGQLNPQGLNNFADDVNSRFSGLIKLGDFFMAVWNGVKEVAQAVYTVIKPIIDAIAGYVTKLGNDISDALKQLTFSDAIQAINSGIFASFLLVFRGFFGNLGGILRGNGVAFVSQFKKVFSQLQINLKAIELNTNAKTLTQIAIAVALLAASAVALSLVNPVRLGASLAAIAGLMSSLLGAFTLFSKVGGTTGLAKSLALVVVLQGMATAILVLSGAIAILGALPLTSLIQGIVSLAAVMAILVGTFKLLGDIGPGVLAASVAIAILAPSLAVLAGAVAILGAIPFNNLVQGMVAFVAIMAALTLNLTLLNLLGPRVLIAAGAIAILSAAMIPLVGSIALLGALPFANIVQGMVAFIALMATLVGAISLLGLAGPEALIGAVAIAAVALSMIPLVGAIALLGALPLANIIQGMVAFAAALAILVGAILILGFTGPVALLGAAALVAVALAIAVLAPALALLAAIPWDGIGRLLTVLSAGLGILVVMGILLIPASVGFTLLGTAILLIGAGVFLAAAGIGLLAAGIGVLVGVGTAGIGIFTLGIQAFIAQLPALGAGVGAAIVAMATVIGTEAPQLITAFVSIILAMLAAINTIVPQLVNTATIIILTLVNALVILVPRLVEAGLKIINGILSGIASNIGQTAAKGVEIVTNFINGVSGKLPALADSGAKLVISFINSIASAIDNNRASLNKAIANLANAITDGLSGGLTSGVKKVTDAASKLVGNIPSAIKSILGIHSPSRVAQELLEFFGDGMVIGLQNRTSDVTDASTTLGQSAVNSLKDALSGVNDLVNTNMDLTPTITPVVDLTSVKNAAPQVAGLLGAPSLSLNGSDNVAQSVSLQDQAKAAQLVLDTSAVQTPSTVVNLTQNNTSPTSLSTVDIYRQTNNQLSTLKGVLGVVNQSGSA